MASPYPNEPVEIEDVKFHTPLNLIQPVQPLDMGNGRAAPFVLGEDFVASYHVEGKGRVYTLTAPAGMLTDLISSPFHSIVNPSHPGILPAAIIHDYLYVAWEALNYRPIKRDRKFADDILLKGIESIGKVGWFKRRLVYRSVRAGGWIPFNERDGRSFLTLEELQAVKDAKN